jgi:hypothetical protein
MPMLMDFPHSIQYGREGKRFEGVSCMENGGDLARPIG